MTRGPEPDLAEEEALFSEGALLVGGVDEVGRGAWAGPVTVGIVTIRAGHPAAPEGIRDSKLVSKARRRLLAPAIDAWAVESAVGDATPAECDALGMRAAVALAASRAIESLCELPDAVIVDGPFDLLDGRSEQLASLVAGHAWRQRPPKVVPVVKADQRCLSVAAASIVAKVGRDGAMAQLASSYPAYDFDGNVGYPSPSHQRALFGYGLTAIHRRSWSFVDALRWEDAGR